MNYTIGELASRPVISVEAETLVIEALRLMSARRISCVVVLMQGEPVGILTERDVVFAANWVIGQPELRIREVMSKPVLTAPSGMSLVDAYQLFKENQVRHLIVLGEQMELDGIFTQTNLVRTLHGALFAEGFEVAALMSSHVWHVPATVSARHALSLMASHAISGVVIIDERRRPVGIFTERDAVRLVAAGTDISALPVSAAMTPSVVTIPASASPLSALKLMRSHEVRRLLVVDEGGAMAGMLTQTDLSRILDLQELSLVDRVAAEGAAAARAAAPSLH